MIYRRLLELQAQKKFSNREIALKLGITDSGYAKMIQNRSCTVAVLEKIAALYDVKISTFFEDTQLKQYPENDNPNIIQEPCANCQQLLSEINRLNKELISAQKEIIAALKGDHKKEMRSAAGA